MALVKLTTPIDEATIRSLNVGDTVSITGRLYTGRDAVHHRIHTGTKPPVDLEGQIIYHCGPVMVKEDEQWVCKAAGPTTSSREEPYEHEVIRDYKIRGVIGKGGMGEKTLAACREYGAVYLHAIGGAAQIDLDLFGVELSKDGAVAAFQIRKTMDDCCASYRIYSLEKTPRLLRTITGGSVFTAAHRSWSSAPGTPIEDGPAGSSSTGIAWRRCARMMSMHLRWAIVTSQASTLASSGRSG